MTDVTMTEAAPTGVDEAAPTGEGEAAPTGEGAAAVQEEKVKTEERVAGAGGGDGGSGEGEAPVMDEKMLGDVKLTRVQMDTLRHQIAAYSHICQQNILLTQQQAEDKKPGAAQQYVKSTANHTSATIASIASAIGVPITQSTSSQPSYPAPIYSKDNRTPSAPRWNPTAAQLARLEELFATGMGTPNGDLRTQITAELARLGQINEANVYNWFQNKKARMKKKAQEEAAAAMLGR